MKRQFVGWGLFAPDICRGRAMRDDCCRSIYAELIRCGFVETRWQLIYDGQIGGLVCPCNNGLNEIHIRFYTDRIFAELELSRTSLFHFVFPLFNANGYVVDLLRDKIPDIMLGLLAERSSQNLRDEEAARPIWRHRDQQDPYAEIIADGHPVVGAPAAWLHRRLGWRSMLGLVSLAIAGSAYLVHGAPWLACGWLLLALLSMRYMPTTGRPDGANHSAR